MAVGLPPRDYLIEEYTRTICPHCWEEGPRRADEPDTFIDGMLVAHADAIWLRRWCPKHGETESLYEENAELWRARRGWSTPTLTITPDRPDNARGFPEGYRDGLPAGHGQHTCILLLNATEHCNLSCPTCYASALDPASPADKPERPTLEEIDRTVDTMIARENGRLGVLMLSGGEPTVRRDLGDMLCRLAEKPITRILLNTNGRRIARDDKLVALLSDLKDRVEIYLQFDGLDPATHIAMRGEDLLAEKLEVLDRLGKAEVVSTVVMAAQLGVNDHELGAVFEKALHTPFCQGLAIQPVFGSGRTIPIDGQNRLTPTGVLQRLEKQTKGQAKVSDFIPLPCSHRDCCDIGYYIQDRKGHWRSLSDLVGRDTLKDWIHLAANTISFESVSDTVKSMVKEGVLQRLFSEQQAPSSLKVAADLFKLCGCIPGLHEAIDAIKGSRDQKRDLRRLASRTFRVTVKMFMDAHTFHEHRIRQCCVHVGTFEEDPRRYSFCWRWLFADSHDFPERALKPLPMAR